MARTRRQRRLRPRAEDLAREAQRSLLRCLFWFLLLAIAAVVAALAAKLNNGYALLVAPPYRIELSLNLLIILVVGSFVSLYLGLRIIVHTVRLPSQVREWRRQMKQARSRAKLDA